MHLCTQSQPKQVRHLSATSGDPQEVTQMCRRTGEVLSLGHEQTGALT